MKQLTRFAFLFVLLLCLAGCDILKREGDSALSVYVDKETALASISGGKVYVRSYDSDEVSKDFSFDGSIGTVYIPDLNSGEAEVRVEIENVGSETVITELLSGESIAVHFSVYTENSALVIDGRSEYPVSFNTANYIDEFDAAYLSILNSDDEGNNDEQELRESIILNARGGFFDSKSFIYSGPGVYLNFTDTGFRGFSFVNDNQHAVLQLSDYKASGTYSLTIADSNKLYTDGEDRLYVNSDNSPVMHIYGYPGFVQEPDPSLNPPLIARDPQADGYSMNIEIIGADTQAMFYALIAVRIEPQAIEVLTMPTPAVSAFSWSSSGNYPEGIYRVFTVAADSDLSWITADPYIFYSADVKDVITVLLSGDGDIDMLLINYFTLEIYI